MTSSHRVEDNLEAAGKLLREAKEAGAELACLPENFSFIGLKDADKLGVAEAAGSGPIQQFLSATARALGLWILGGTTVIKGDSARRVANASLLFDAQGKRVARYDKIHLFDVTIPGRNEQYLESTHVTPGHQVVLADTPVGRLGLSVCYDMRFPPRSRSRPGAPTGSRCCGRGPSRTSATSWPRRSGARIRAAAKPMAIR
jgi:nitrilase